MKTSITVLYWQFLKVRVDYDDTNGYFVTNFPENIMVGLMYYGAV